MKIIEETYKWKPGVKFSPNVPDTIVIHHAGSKSCTAQEIHRWHLDRGWIGFAYHYFIRKDGTIHHGRQENQRGGHLLGAENINTVGICLEGCYTDYIAKGQVLTEKIVPESQLKALIELCMDIKSRWAIKAIKKHSDYSSAQQAKKDCPGRYFPWEQFTLMVHNPFLAYQKIIQEKCHFSNPDGVWKVLNTHPFAEALYKQWVESYK